MGDATRESMAAATVALRNVLDDRGRLRQHYIAVGDNRRRAGRVEIAVLLWRQEIRAAIVPIERVGQLEFFHEPDHAIRLGHPEVVNSNHGFAPPLVVLCKN